MSLQAVLNCQDIHPEVLSCIERMVERMNGVTDEDRFREKKLILFTSRDHKADAEALYQSAPDKYELIHSQGTGRTLEALKLFEILPKDIAYMVWNLCAAELMTAHHIESIVLIANPVDTTSTLYSNELRLLLGHLRNNKPIQIINHNSGSTLSETAISGLCQPFLNEFLQSNGTRGVLYEKWQDARENIGGVSMETFQPFRNAMVALLKSTLLDSHLIYE